jgi:hypothetical protein
MSDWTDELKAEIIEKYQAANPTADNSAEIVQELATECEKTANGVRLILSKAGVYVKKTPAKGGSTPDAADSDKPKRVSKADAIEALTSAIADSGQTADEEILAKLTGKAAQYFTGIIRGISASE